MIQLKEGELLSNHTTFRIGGAAKYFAVPKNEEEIMEAVDFAIVKGLPHANFFQHGSVRLIGKREIFDIQAFVRNIRSVRDFGNGGFLFQ